MISDIKSKDLHETSLSRSGAATRDCCQISVAQHAHGATEGTERERRGEMGRDGERAVSEGSLRKPLLRLPPFHVVAVAAAMFTESRRLVAVRQEMVGISWRF